MATSWLRLWHDMPNDPKWRTISRVSKQPISAVICVYLHLLVDASANATERGRTQSLFAEDIGSALDLETADVEAILAAMQGRVLDGDRIKGWNRRQPAREDGSAERARLWREKRKAEKAAEAGDSSDPERMRTQPNAEKRPDTDTEVKENKTRACAREGSSDLPPKAPEQKPPDSNAPFAMTLTWQPDRSLLKTYAVSSGVPLEAFTCEEIGHFRTRNEPAGLLKSEKEWTSALVSWVRNGRVRSAGRSGSVVQLQARERPPDFSDPNWAKGELEDLS